MSKHLNDPLKRAALRLALVAGASIGAIAAAGSAAAQQDDVAQTPPAASTEAEDQQDTIVVTGSRIARKEFTSASPVQVILMSVFKGLGNRSCSRFSAQGFRAVHGRTRRLQDDG